MPSLETSLGALTVLAHMLGAIAALSVARRAHTAQGAVAWVFGLTLAPWVGLPALLLLGPPDFKRIVAERAPARLKALARAARIHGFSAPPPEDPDGGRLRDTLAALGPLPILKTPAPSLLTDSDCFEAMFEAIDAAEHSIFVQFYIVRDDGVGRRFAAVLEEKARRGLRVCFLYDEVGARNAPRAYWRRLEAAGVEVRAFAIRSRWPKVTRINFRDHRKAVIADGRVAVIGGPNLGDEYLGRDPDLGAWRDTAIRLEGPAAAAVEACFAEHWLWTGGGDLPPALQIACGDRRTAPTLILPSGPADGLPGALFAILHLICAARERLWIASPYFVPDLDVMSALKLAALRGVDVRILIPDRPDHYVVWLAGFAYAEDAQAAGVRLHRYQGGFMHQKVIVVDETVAAVGTANLDNRSLRLNFELTAFTFDRDHTCDVAAMLERDFARSALNQPGNHIARSLAVRILAPAARLLSPLL